jgi:hypothetical protein
MVIFSYSAAAFAMCLCATYLVFRIRLFVAASSMLLAALLLIYGPAYLVYMYTRGAIEWYNISPVFEEIARRPHFEEVKLAMTLSIALMFIGVVAGCEIIQRLAPARARQLDVSLRSWDRQPLAPGVGDPWLLLMAIVALGLFSLSVSIVEHHFTVIREYFSYGKTELEKIDFRQRHGGSGVYAFRVLTTSVTPMFVVWGMLSGLARRSAALILAAAFLLAVTMLAKLDTLSKGPPALFMFQMLFAAYAYYRNEVTWRAVLIASGLALCVLYPIVTLAIPEVSGYLALRFMGYRIFNVPNEVLLEYFAVFPHIVPHTWGADIRLVSALVGKTFDPAYNVVARIWHGDAPGITSNALFIADGWAQFSYYGVLVLSVLAGAICRAIDLVWLLRGKTAVNIAILAAVFIGIYHLLQGALTTALLTGGLLLCPLVAWLLVAVSNLVPWCLEKRSKPIANEA